MAVVTARAFHRGYVSSGKRAGQVRRFHVIREHGPGDREAKHGLCGIQAWPCTDSDPVIFSPMPSEPPEGLEWCPSCIGKLAELKGRLAEFAAVLAGAG